MEDSQQLQLEQQVKDIFLKVSNLPESEGENLSMTDTLFQGGLGLDSVDLLEFIVQLDRKFGLKVRNDEEGKKTLASLSSVVSAVNLHQQIQAPS